MFTNPFKFLANAFQSGRNYLAKQATKILPTRFLETDTRRIARVTSGLTLDNLISSSEGQAVRKTEDYLVRTTEAIGEIEQMAIDAWRSGEKSPAEILVAINDRVALARKGDFGVNIYGDVEREKYAITMSQVNQILSKQKASTSPTLTREFREHLGGNYVVMIERAIARLHYREEVSDRGLLTNTLNRLIGEVEERTGIKIEQATEENVKDILAQYRSEMGRQRADEREKYLAPFPAPA